MAINEQIITGRKCSRSKFLSKNLIINVKKTGNISRFYSQKNWACAVTTRTYGGCLNSAVRGLYIYHIR